MEKLNNNGQFHKYAKILSVVGLLLILTGVTYSFFNYTRTGNANVLRVGSVHFASSETNNINLTDIFPISREAAPNDSTNSSEVLLTISGDTNYGDGVEYLVSIDDVHMETSLHKNLPIGIIVTPEKTGELGTSDDSYFTNRGGNTSIYKVLASETVKDDDYLLVGYIRNGVAEINGTIGIRAFIDLDHIAISDTFDGNESDNMGTTNDWVRGRTVITTNEWNSLTGNNALSFRIRVEANEGVWVPEPASRNDIDHVNSLFQVSEGTAPFEGRKDSITEINFIRMSEEMINTHADAVDITAENGEGMVKAWIDGTVLYIASPGETYLPSSSSGFFMNFTNVTKINFNNVNTSEVTLMPGFFQNCSSLTSVDLRSFDTSNVTNMSSMFSNCSSLTDIDLSYLDTSSIQHMSGMFNGCTSLQTINVSNLGSDYLVSSYMFSTVGSTSLTKVNMTNFNFGTQTGLSFMFSDLPYVEEFILRNADTSNITSMNAAFFGLANLKTIDLRGIDTSNVTNMMAMFEGCSDLENILGLNEFDTSSVTEMNTMFSDAASLTSLNLSNFNTSNVTSMAAMFSNCTGLTSLNLSSFNTTSLTNMAGMFFGTTSLTTIDLSSFNTSNVTEMNLLFAMGEMGNNDTLTPVNNALTTIKVGSNWSTNSVTSDTNMFYNCTHLVGGSGTVFDSNYVNKTYAHVDGGQTNPGYLT